MGMQLTEENYYSDIANYEYMSVSQFKDFNGTYGRVACEEAALAKLKGEYAQASSTALMVGSYVDRYFEGTLDAFKSEHTEMFKKDGNLKAEYVKADALIQRAERDELFMKYMSGEKQVIMTAELYGTPWKIKMDSYIPGVAIVDLKVMASLTKLEWVRDIGYLDFVHDKAGYGIAQWTYWSRKQNLQKYAQEKGASIGDLEMQLEFLIQELSSSYKSVLNVLKTATSVSQASNAVLLNFEKPANQGSSVQKERAECGQKFYDKYASGKGGTSIMGKTITTGWLSAVINGIKIKSDLRCNLDNYSSRSSRDASYVTMHYTGNNKDTARANANYFGGAGRNASAHLFVDDTEIYQSVPLNSVAWHCGAQTYKHAYCRNANSIGIEMCCTAGNYKISEKTKQNAAYLCAYICRMLGISAGEVDKYVLRHWDVTGKNCPAQMAGSNNAEWVAFKNMVKSILNGGGTGNSTSGGTQTKQMYRVRKTWADAASQKGAFTSLENAKKCADENKGYSVFDSNGNKVYPASANTGTSCNYVVKITVDGLRYRDNPGTSGTKVLGYLKKNYKYTVVEERTVNGVKWGKLKSGAGWFSLQSEYSVRC